MGRPARASSWKERLRSGDSVPMGTAVFLVAFVGLALLSVPLTGGRLGALAEVRFRWIGLLVGALVVQVAIISFVHGGPSWFHPAVHIATYGVAIVFLVANFSMPGLPLIAFGGLANFIAIAANGGVMPASKTALVDAARRHSHNAFDNSGVVQHARLRFLGDIFAMPGWMPLHNVFSVGDLLIALGAAVAIHAVCDTRPARAGRRVLHRTHSDGEQQPSASDARSLVS